MAFLLYFQWLVYDVTVNIFQELDYKRETHNVKRSGHTTEVSYLLTKFSVLERYSEYHEYNLILPFKIFFYPVANPLTYHKLRK